MRRREDSRLQGGATVVLKPHEIRVIKHRILPHQRHIPLLQVIPRELHHRPHLVRRERRLLEIRLHCGHGNAMTCPIHVQKVHQTGKLLQILFDC